MVGLTELEDSNIYHYWRFVIWCCRSTIARIQTTFETVAKEVWISSIVCLLCLIHIFHSSVSKFMSVEYTSFSRLFSSEVAASNLICLCDLCLVLQSFENSNRLHRKLSTFCCCLRDCNDRALRNHCWFHLRFAASGMAMVGRAWSETWLHSLLTFLDMV